MIEEVRRVKLEELNKQAELYEEEKNTIENDYGLEEIRNKLDIQEKDPLEIYVQEDCIILKKYESNCIFCGNTKDLIEYKEKLICKKCLKDLS